MNSYRQLSVSTDTTINIRTEVYDGEEYLIIPCIVLIGDSVVFGLNAKGPEFIPANEIAFSTQQWANRPIIPDHPDNGLSTANTPTYLQQHRFGWTFFPEFTDNKLKMEAWLSRSRAEKVGDSALSVIQDIEDGMIVELSCGAWVEVEEREGTSPSGESYSYVWHNIASDHLALGLNGGRGACSIDMGCGGMRVQSQSQPQVLDNTIVNTNTRIGQSQQHSEDVTINSVELTNPVSHVIKESEESMPNPIPVQSTTTAATIPEAEQSLLRRVLSTLRIPSFRSNTEDTGPSDWNIRSQLGEALYLIEPGFGWIEDVFQDSGTVIYSCFPFSPHEAYYRRTFTIDSNNVITLGDESSKEQVQKPRDRWETMASDSTEPTPAMAASSASTSTCQCQRTNNSNANVNNSGPHSDSEGEPMASQELMNKFAGLSDDKMKKLLASLDEQPTSTPTPETTTTTAPSTTITPTPATIDGLDLDTVRTIVAQHKAQEQNRRAVLLSALSAPTEKVFTKEQLEAKSTQELEQLAALVDKSSPVQVDYSFARPVASPLGAGDYKSKPAPDPYSLKLGKNLRTGEKLTN